MAEVSPFRLASPGKLSEAERILAATKESHDNIVKGGRTPSVEQQLAFVRREAIVITLTRLNNGENPFDRD